MALFCVSYDLMNKKDYKSLWDEMERLGAHKALESVYLVSLTNDDAKTVRDHLLKFIDTDDKLLVVKLIQASSQRCFKGTIKWIEDNKAG
jgi:CRISPR/Cas system-associated endoribonuclease Cas2